MLRLAFGCACLIACGGTEPTTDSGTTDATTTYDSHFGFDEGSDAFDSGIAADATPPSGTCPSSAPAEGSSCSGGDGLECEYGTSWDLPCNARFVCEGDHTWHAEQTITCAWACPSSYPYMTDAGCSSYASCDYPQGHCDCVTSCGGPPPPDQNWRWSCKAEPANCPWPRPDLGTACANEGKYCGYDVGCCGGTELTCSAGLWRGSPAPVCP